MLERDRRCEVLVVGAGITGAMVAEHLTALGHEVCLVDRERPGFGSTAASTAMLQWEIDRPLTELAEFYGFERAADAYRRSLQAVSGLKSLIDDRGLKCVFRPRSSLYLAGDGAGARELRAEHDLRTRAGLPGAYLDYRTLRREFAFDREAAILSPGSADADPLCLSHALIALAVARGTSIFDGEASELRERRRRRPGRARQWSFDRGRAGRAGNGLCHARFSQDRSSYAASSWAIATPPQTPDALWRDGVLIWEASEKYLYARTTADNRIVIGGEDDNNIVDPAKRDELMPEKAATILDKLKVLYPKANATADYVWSGAFGETTDGLPLIGRGARAYPHLYAAYGYGGNGITFSFLAARMIARMIAGEDEPWYTDFAVDRPRP